MIFQVLYLECLIVLRLKKQHFHERKCCFWSIRYSIFVSTI
jgi:hypothetical protein